VRNTAATAFTTLPSGVPFASGTFAGLSVTFSESPLTLDRDTQISLISQQLLISHTQY
jgi:hypothetical protein